MHSFMVPPPKIFINCKGESSDFTAQKPGRQHPNQVNAISNGTSEIMSHLIGAIRKRHRFCDIPAKDAYNR